MYRLINAGFGNMVALGAIVAVISPNSAPAKRLKDEARDSGRLVDITQGRRTRSIIITAANQVFLSSVQVETLAGRFQLEAERPLELADVDAAPKPPKGGASAAGILKTTPIL
ncbi:MAG: DUF370 domain-containing protein [Candidatus Adiutrix sp.]|jgi:regulator of extracellular matrix RemA (YlzA/DUF370 family)|nr:DUF370 domain-containing protein [Candidatus Adiutrix sp.]